VCEHPDPGSTQRPLPVGLEDSPLLSPAKASSQRVLDEKKKINCQLSACVIHTTLLSVRSLLFLKGLLSPSI
jgi:hypothetical protein